MSTKAGTAVAFESSPTRRLDVRWRPSPDQEAWQSLSARQLSFEIERLLALPMIDHMMVGKLLADRLIAAGFVAVQDRQLVGVLVHNRLDVGDGGALDVEGAGNAAALDQRQHHALVFAATVGRHAIAAALIGLVDLDRLTLAAHRLAAVSLHRLAQAVAHEPGALVGDAQHAAHLVGAHALLGGAQDEGRLQPLVQGDVAALENRADHDRELLAASLALVVPLAPLDRGGSLQRAAVAAGTAPGPQEALKPFAGLRGVLKDCVVPRVLGGHAQT